MGWARNVNFPDFDAIEAPTGRFSPVETHLRGRGIGLQIEFIVESRPTVAAFVSSSTRSARSTTSSPGQQWPPRRSAPLRDTGQCWPRPSSRSAAASGRTFQVPIGTIVPAPQRARPVAAVVPQLVAPIGDVEAAGAVAGRFPGVEGGVRPGGNRLRGTLRRVSGRFRAAPPFRG